MDDESNSWLMAWEDHGTASYRRTTTGEDVAWVVAVKAGADESTTDRRGIMGFATARAFGPAGDPERQGETLVEPDPAHTFAGVKERVDAWLAERGYVLIDRRPDVLTEYERSVSAWVRTHNDDGPGATRYWFGRVPAAVVREANAGFAVWVISIGDGTARVGQAQAASFREGLLLADGMLRADGWQLPGEQELAVLLDGVPIRPEYLDRRARGRQLVEPGSFPWAAAMVVEGLTVERESVGPESRWDLYELFEIGDDDVHAHDWVVVETPHPPSGTEPMDIGLTRGEVVSAGARKPE